MKKILRKFGKKGSHFTFGEKMMKQYGLKLNKVYDVEIVLDKEVESILDNHTLQTNISEEELKRVMKK